MKNIIEKVRKFNSDAGTELDRDMLLPSEATNEIRMLDEELEELRKAIDGWKTEKKKDRTVIVKPVNSIKEYRIEVLDALADIIYVAIGTSQKLGLDIEGALLEVCRSNETKYINGRLEKDADGKIKKGDGFVPPNLDDFI